MPTSFEQNIRFAPKPETRLDEFQFDGGLVTDTHETKLKSNQSPNMQNVIFNETGSIKTRNGFTEYNGTSIGANPLTGLIRFYGSGGVQQLITKYTTSLYRGNDVSGAMTQITLGSGVSLVSGNFIDSTIVNGTLLVVDGSNFIQKYRGSTNSNYSTGTISVTNGSSAVVGSGTSWATSTNATAGEYIQLPDTKWYKIVSVISNTSLTIELNYQGATSSGDSYKISPWGEVQGALDDTAPSSLVRPAPDYIENHANRVWALEGNRLRYSALDTSVSGEHFNDWDTANNAGTINIPTGKDSETTGLYSFGESLYIFQRRAIWRLSGNAPANFSIKQVTNEVGMTNRRTLVEWNDILVFLSDLGIILFDGSNIKNISEDVVNTSINNWASKLTPSATLWDNKYLISYTPSGGSANTEALFFDLVRGIFGKFTNITANVFSNWSGGTDDGQIYFGDSSAGKIYQWDSGTTDNGTDITTIYDTPSLGFDQNVNDKTLKKFYVQQIAKADYNMLVRMFSDITTGPTSVNINLSPGTTSLFGTAVFDTDVFSSEGDIITTRVSEFQGLAKFFKFRVEATDPIEVLGLTVSERSRRLS